MRRAFLLAGGLILMGLGIGCDHYHGVCDCYLIQNSALCGFYAHYAHPEPPYPGRHYASATNAHR